MLSDNVSTDPEELITDEVTPPVQPLAEKFLDAIRQLTRDWDSAKVRLSDYSWTITVKLGHDIPDVKASTLEFCIKSVNTNPLFMVMVTRNILLKHTRSFLFWSRTKHWVCSTERYVTFEDFDRALAWAKAYVKLNPDWHAIDLQLSRFAP